MKRIMICSIIIVAALLLSACGIEGKGENMFRRKSNGELADSRLEQIITAIENSDGDAIKSMFSQVALEEAEDIDEGTKQLLDNFPRCIASWKRVVVGASESVDHGAKDKSISASYDVYVGDKQYIISFVDFIIDTEDPESVGLYTLIAYDNIDNKPEAYTGGIYVVIE